MARCKCKICGKELDTKSAHKEEMVYEDHSLSQGLYGRFTGVPIVIDNEIEHSYYELVFEEESNK